MIDETRVGIPHLLDQAEDPTTIRIGRLLQLGDTHRGNDVLILQLNLDVMLKHGS
ncbi:MULTISPECIES: hypothetical protein [Corynebacterium]|uniref:Uncharacterized protein n=1 Tax=Corynebacterium glucuronolyticum TaxID=39791 RepID=A0AAX1L827_9CORY|nr:MULTISPECIES: hypothetical protein [Corynebacterium]MCT1563273.1 hypothetical protein [Corynebacterium glucuronolyticum]QQU88504.1 hypothetical protein I6I68_00405 [Corynebacterium glucuronolyticum]QRP70623.1 hypothetical protein I6J21_00055 [Corynebacterium glucuronolyticum]